MRESLWSSRHEEEEWLDDELETLRSAHRSRRRAVVRLHPTSENETAPSVLRTPAGASFPRKGEVVNTERTTPALTGASITDKPTRAPRQDRNRVEHLYWVTDGKFAAELQIELRAVCGVWIAPPLSSAEVEAGKVLPIVVKTDSGGARITIPIETRDCGNCTRIYEARIRRFLLERLRNKR